MSATVINGKSAACLRTATGDLVYFLFERTYEKNCYPHTPHWGCTAIGTFDEVMERIIGHASACEGGSLQSPAGYIKPENFITHWLQQLKNPIPMVASTVFVGGNQTLRYMEPAEKENARQEIASIFRKHCRDDLAEEIVQGKEVKLDLFQDITLVRAFFGVKGIYAPWRGISHGYAYSTSTASVSDPSLGFTARNGHAVEPTYRLWRLRGDSESLVGQINGNATRYLGWEFQAIGDYINKVLLPLELAKTGISKRLIPEFRDACSKASLLPLETSVAVDPDRDTNKYRYEAACKVAEKLGKPLGLPFQCTVSDLIQADAMYYVTQLSAEQIVWTIPEQSIMATDLLAA